jgi:hypothetical protein
MPEWREIRPPAHGGLTSLSLTLHEERRRNGRYHLQAWDGGKWVYSVFYEWHIWHGHCGGILLLPDFLRQAEHQARRARQARMDVHPLVAMIEAQERQVLLVEVSSERGELAEGQAHADRRAGG